MSRWWESADRRELVAAVEALKDCDILVASGRDDSGRDVAARLAARAFQSSGRRAYIVHCSHLPTLRDAFYELWAEIQPPGSGLTLSRAALLSNAYQIDELLNDIARCVTAAPYDAALVLETVDYAGPIGFDGLRWLRELASACSIPVVLIARTESSTMWHHLAGASLMHLRDFTRSDIWQCLLTYATTDLTSANEAIDRLGLSGQDIPPFLAYSQLHVWQERQP
jgi:hypothetical protein